MPNGRYHWLNLVMGVALVPEALARTHSQGAALPLGEEPVQLPDSSINARRKWTRVGGQFSSRFMQAGAMEARVTYPASVGQRLFFPPARR